MLANPTSNQLLSTPNNTLHHLNVKNVACNGVSEIELKVQLAISTLTDVLKDLQKRRTDLSDLLNPLPLSQVVDTSHMPHCQDVYLTGNNLASVVFPNGMNTENVAVVELIERGDMFSLNKCSVCDKMFDDRQKLRNHSRIHKQIRKYKCGVCSLGFPVPSKLKEHMRTHTGERPYECELCLRCFTKSSSLKRHRRVHKSFLQPSPADIGGHSLLQDQVVQNVDRVLSPAFRVEEIETEASCVTYDATFLAHTESELSSASVSP